MVFFMGIEIPVCIHALGRRGSLFSGIDPIIFLYRLHGHALTLRKHHGGKFSTSRLSTYYRQVLSSAE